MSATEEELRKMFPNAPESFFRRNAGIDVSHSAIGIALAVQTPSDGRQIRTVKAEREAPVTLLPLVQESAGESISLILPYPPSANTYWRSIISKGRVMVLVSSEAKHYKRAIAIIAKSKVKTPLTGPLVLTIHVFRPQKSGDLSNRIKVLEDALQGVCYEDDNQIVELHAFRHDDKDNPRVELTIASASEDDSQPLLALEP